MRRGVCSAAFAAVTTLVGASAGSAQTPTMPYDHIHVNVPDPAATANWYEKQFGGRRITDGVHGAQHGVERGTDVGEAAYDHHRDESANHRVFDRADCAGVGAEPAYHHRHSQGEVSCDDRRHLAYGWVTK